MHQTDSNTVTEYNSENLIEVARESGRLDVIINRPAKRNAISRAALESLKATFEKYADDESIKVATLTGAGNKSFAAGGDLRDLSSVRTYAEAAEMSRNARAALDTIRTFAVPVIAVLDGDALGGGAELAAACDMRIMAAHARIGFIQGRLAITTAWGGGIDLPAIVGPSRALTLLTRGDILSPAEAKALGLADMIVESHEKTADAVARFIAPMLKLPRKVLAAFKAVNLARRRGESYQELGRIESERFADTWIQEDHWSAANAILTRSSHE